MDQCQINIRVTSWGRYIVECDHHGSTPPFDSEDDAQMVAERHAEMQGWEKRHA